MNDNLIELLRHLAVDLDDPEPDRSLLSEIRDLGDQVVPRLVEALAMDGLRATTALSRLQRLLGEDKRTRFIAVKAILTIGPSKTEELCRILVEALESRSGRGSIDG